MSAVYSMVGWVIIPIGMLLMLLLLFAFGGHWMARHKHSK